MPLKAYLVQRMKLGIVKGKLAAWTIKRLKADNDNVSEETTTGFAGLAPENAEDYTALVAQGGEMQEVAQGRQVDEAAIPQGVGSVSVAGSQGTQVNLAAPSLGTTSLRPGGGIIVRQCTKHALNTYYATDHLGTVRFTKTFDETGTEVATSTHDYEPFGVEITPTDEWGNTHRFTGHERDAETGNDYMHFRFFSASMGRFQKPDSNFDNPTSNPQGWNLYSYVKGNPVNFNDPTGHQSVDPDRSVAAAKDQKGSHSPLAQGPGDLVTGKDTAEQAAKKAKAAGDPNAAGQAAPQAGGGGGDPKPATSDSQKEKKGLLETIKDKVVNLAQKFAAWAYDAIAGSPPPKNEAGQTAQIKQAAKQDDDYGMSDAVSDLGAKSTAQLKGVAVTGAGEATKLGIAAAEGAITDGAVEALPTGARIVVKGIEAVQAAQDKKNALANTASAKPAESNPDDNK